MKKHGGVFVAQILLILSHSVVAREGIGCFQCRQPLTGQTIEPSLLCSQFDESFRFQVFCPFSTLCMKHTTFFTFSNGTSIPVSVERGCAPQKDEFGFIDNKIRKWVVGNKVAPDAYQQGCYDGADNGSPSRPPRFCYCASTLCNGASPVAASSGFFFLVLITLHFIQA